MHIGCVCKGTGGVCLMVSNKMLQAIASAGGPHVVQRLQEWEQRVAVGVLCSGGGDRVFNGGGGSMVVTSVIVGSLVVVVVVVGSIIGEVVVVLVVVSSTVLVVEKP